MNWKNIIWKLLFPPIWLIFLLIPVSAAGLAYVFLQGLESSPEAAAVYALAFYSLVIFCFACWKSLPAYLKNAKTKVHSNQYAHRYLTDRDFKTHVNLYRSLSINLLYVAANALSAVLYSTHWFAIFAIYYGILAVMRFLLLRYMGKNKIGESRLGELKRSRLCAFLLLTVNLALSGAVLMMVYFHRGFEYQGILIYVMALYSFYTTITAIVDTIRYRKYNSPVLSVSNVIKLTAALVSMLPLETAMFSQFGEELSADTQKIMIMATGGGIAAIIIVIALGIIVQTTKEIREIGEHK